MTDANREAAARDLVEAFARETGVTSTAPARRYLWTDAFAVCACLALHHRSGGTAFLELATRLTEQVHHVLGRFRAGDGREGWVSGLDEREGERRPTAGGLRIGKPLPERGRHDAYDAVLEWQRDGQYFHYLTRWVHALGRMAAVADAPEYLRHALDLARAAHAGFLARDTQGRPVGLHWKMSVDLTRPLVAGAGSHDPLDGLVTFADLRHAAGSEPRLGEAPSLDAEIATLSTLVRDRDWFTDDPLGAGGLLVLLWRASALHVEGVPVDGLELRRLASAAFRSLEAVGRSRSLGRAPEYRLPFRELGFAMGLHALESIAELDERDRPELTVDPGRAYERWGVLADELEDFWLRPANQAVETWRDHADINRVMLAASLVPDGYLGGVPAHHGGGARRT